MLPWVFPEQGAQALQGTHVPDFDGAFRDLQDGRDVADRKLFQVAKHEDFPVPLPQPFQGRAGPLGGLAAFQPGVRAAPAGVQPLRQFQG